MTVDFLCGVSQSSGDAAAAITLLRVDHHPSMSGPQAIAGTISDLPDRIRCTRKVRDNIGSIL